MRPEVALELVGLPPFFGTYIRSRPKGTRKIYLPVDPQKYGISERRLDLASHPRRLQTPSATVWWMGNDTSERLSCVFKLEHNCI